MKDNNHNKNNSKESYSTHQYSGQAVPNAFYQGRGAEERIPGKGVLDKP